jgi:hypothetical protein
LEESTIEHSEVLKCFQSRWSKARATVRAIPFDVASVLADGPNDHGTVIAAIQNQVHAALGEMSMEPATTV